MQQKTITYACDACEEPVLWRDLVELRLFLGGVRKIGGQFCKGCALEKTEEELGGGE